MLKLGAHIFKRPLARHGWPTHPKLNVESYVIIDQFGGSN